MAVTCAQSVQVIVLPLCPPAVPPASTSMFKNNQKQTGAIRLIHLIAAPGCLSQGDEILSGEGVGTEAVLADDDAVLCFFFIHFA